MDSNIIENAFMGLISLMLAIVGYGVKSFRGEHKSLSAEHDKLKDSHNSLALKLSENYSTKTDLIVARSEFTQAISRVHERLDTMAQSQDKKTDIIIELLRSK